MRSSFDTLVSVYKAVTRDSLATRREISDFLGISVVSVSKAAKILIEAGILSSDGQVTTGGRRSEFLCPAYKNTYLAINLCEKPFSYSISHLGATLSSSDIHYVPYLRDMDLASNVSILAREIKRACSSPFIAAAVAVPCLDYESDSKISYYWSDYFGDDLTAIFEMHGISVDIFAPRGSALQASRYIDNENQSSLYVSINDRVYALFSGNTDLELDWSGVRVDGMRFSDILKCALPPDTLAHKTGKLLSFASDIFSADKILIDTSYLPEETVQILLECSEAIEDVTDCSPIIDGLFELMARKEIEKLSVSNNFEKK